MGGIGGLTLFVVINSLFPFFLGIFAIYFFLNVMKFMKEKIELDKQRIEQTNRFLELYKNSNDFNS